MSEVERRELANQHRDEVVPGSGRAIKPWPWFTEKLPTRFEFNGGFDDVAGVTLLREDSIVRVGVAVLILDLENGTVLLLKRTGSHGADTWAAPGGWMDFGESPPDTARREMREELGVEIGLRDDDVAWTNDVFEEDGKHCLIIWYRGYIVDGEPRIMEPDKTTELRWVPIGGPFPEPLFLPLANRLPALS